MKKKIVAKSTEAVYLLKLALLFTMFWVALPALMHYPLSLTKFTNLNEFPAHNVYVLMGISIDLLLILIAIRKFRQDGRKRWMVWRIREGKLRSSYEHILNLKKGKLKGPWYLTIHSQEDYHEECEPQALYVCSDNGNGRGFTLFQVRPRKCYEGKNCEVCEAKEQEFLTIHPEAELIVVHHDESLAKLPFLPTSLDRDYLSDFLGVNVLSVKS